MPAKLQDVHLIVDNHSRRSMTREYQAVGFALKIELVNRIGLARRAPI